MVSIIYDFVKPGSVAEVEDGRVYLDVGNRLVPGVLDHHQPDAPDTCTARLVITHPEYVVSQIKNGQITLTTHQDPDLDACSAVYFAERVAKGESISASAGIWADLVDDVDRGGTRVDPTQAERSVYALYMAYTGLAADQLEAEVVRGTRSQRGLEAGRAFIDRAVKLLESATVTPDSLGSRLARDFPEAAYEVRKDAERYEADLRRCVRLEIALPEQGRVESTKTVPGVWIDRPSARRFKAFARGDRREVTHTWVFLAVRFGEDRTIFSVPPDAGVSLYGLGAALECAERRERVRLDRPRTGPVRPGYDNPDPWYDGRAPLHNYTIVDAPRSGTVLDQDSIWRVLVEYGIEDWNGLELQ